MIEIKIQGLQWYATKDGIRISPFFSVESDAIDWVIDGGYEL